MNLGKLFDRYGSDKNRNGYAVVYESLFKSIRHNVNEILEVGIGTLIPGAPSSMVGYSLPGYSPGGSLRAWRDYFPNAKIVGMDIASDTQIVGEERIATCLCDSRDGDQIEDILESINPASDGSIVPLHGRFNIIIDDGLHTHDSQLSTLANLFDYVKEGGFYIVEDVYPNSPFLAEIKKAVGGVVGNTPWFTTEHKNLVIFSKREELA